MAGLLEARLAEPRRFLQVLTGPRQAGKTTLARQVMEALPIAAHYASADLPTLREAAWLQEQWEVGRVRARHAARDGALLVLDEIQKIPDWSRAVKALWDADTTAGVALKVVLLGSSPLLMQRGLAESLAGRFEIIPVGHWTFAEMREAFGWDLDRYVYFGGFPGAAPLVDDQLRWTSYIMESLIETTISRDILLMTRVDKPALLRRLFELGCEHSGQILSYQKMVGQLQEAGNTTTLAHYLDLLGGAGFLVGLPKFMGRLVRQRASSPKLLALNTALMSAVSGHSFDEARADTALWGRLVETSVGAHLVNGARGLGWQVSYWADGAHEVDFIVHRKLRTVAVEVKSGVRKSRLPGLDALRKRHRLSGALLIGIGGIGVEEFLAAPLDRWLP